MGEVFIFFFTLQVGGDREYNERHSIDAPPYVYTPHLQGRKAIQSYYEKAAIKPNNSL